MRFKGTAALFLLLVLLGGYVYWTDIRGREEREQAEASAVQVLPVDDEEIRSIRLTYPESTFGARRTETGWEFLDRPELEADADQWNTLAGNVGRVEFDEVVAPVTDDLAQFGLADPRVRIDVELVDGTAGSILFGRENPGGNFHYVKRGSDDEILLAATSWSGLFEKDLAAMRDKTILRFDQDAITDIRISGETELALSGGDEGWRMVEPIDWPADQSRVTTLLGTIAFASADGFATDDAADDATGFDSPSWRVVLEPESTDSDDVAPTHELLIGRPVGDPGTEDIRYYARDMSRPAVFLIDAELPDMLGRPLVDWRDKRIATFDRGQVMEVAIEIEGRNPIRLSRADPASPWVLESGEPADGALVSELLGSLEFEQATAIIDNPGPAGNYGLEDPRIRVVLSGSGGRVLLDGALGSGTPDSGVYWTTSQTDVVFEASADLWNTFNLDPEALVGPTAPPDPGEAP